MERLILCVLSVSAVIVFVSETLRIIGGLRSAVQKQKDKENDK